MLIKKENIVKIIKYEYYIDGDMFFEKKHYVSKDEILVEYKFLVSLF